MMRHLVAGLLLVLVSSSHSKPLPHLVFVLIDDLGFNDNWDRAPDIKWPAVSKLALEGISLEHFYTMPLCTPTRASLMTGRWPFRLGLQHNVIVGGDNYGMPLNETTLPQKLKAAGYRTHGVGKWHLGYFNNESCPTSRGFDSFYGYWEGMSDYYTHSAGVGVDLHDNLLIDKSQSGRYSTYLFEEKIEAVVTAHKAGYPDVPLFLYYPMQNVHSPLETPNPIYDVFINETCLKLPNSDRQVYCQMAMMADSALGNLTALLDSTFDGEDLLMVVSGDNGGMPAAAGNNFPLRGHKSEMWEGGIRNNCFLRSKTLIPQSLQGKRYAGGVVHMVDWHATFAVLGGAQPNPAGFALDGLDVFEAILMNQTSPRQGFPINIDQLGNCGGGPDNDDARFKQQQQQQQQQLRLGQHEQPAPSACQVALAKECPGLKGNGPTCFKCAYSHEADLKVAGCDFDGTPPVDILQYCKPSGPSPAPSPAPPCGTPAMGYRYGKYKYLESVSNDTWYPIPTTTLSPWTSNTPWDILTGVQYTQIEVGGVRIGASEVLHAAMEKRAPAAAAAVVAVNVSNVHVDRDDQQPGWGPGGAIVTVMFDLEADPYESVNLLDISPLPADVAVALAAIKAELAAFLKVAVPPGNTTQDGRFADLCQKDGAVGPWCPYPTQAECIASATPGAPDDQ